MVVVFFVHLCRLNRSAARSVVAARDLELRLWIELVDEEPAPNDDT